MLTQYVNMLWIIKHGTWVMLTAADEVNKFLQGSAADSNPFMTVD
jgi:hypothetical protein